MFLAESLHYLLSEGEADPSVVLAPALYIFVGIGPQEVAEEASVWNIGRSHDSLDLIKRAQLWAEAAVHAEDLLIDEGCNREAIEAVSEGLPELDVVSSLALIIEAIDSVDGGTLMVAPQEEEVLGVLDLVGEEETHRL